MEGINSWVRETMTMLEREKEEEFGSGLGPRLRTEAIDRPDEKEKKEEKEE